MIARSFLFSLNHHFLLVELVPWLGADRQATFRYFLGGVTAERDGYCEEVKVIYRPTLGTCFGIGSYGE